MANRPGGYGEWDLEAVSERADLYSLALQRQRGEEALLARRDRLEAAVATRTGQLRHAELRYRTVADFTYDWEWWEAEDGSLLYVSPSAERITGYTPAAFTADPGLLGRIIVEEDRPAWEAHVAGTHQEPGLAEVELRIRHRDGRVRWIEHACQPVRGEDGEALGIRASNRDVTNRKEAEAEARDSARRLTHMGRVAVLGELASSLAHELNQPLTAILSNAQAAQRLLDFEPPRLDDVREALADIVEDDARAGVIIHRLRAMLQRQEVPAEELDVNRLVRSIEPLLHSELVAGNVGVVLDLSPALPAAAGGVIEVQQVLVNLVLNARDAMAALPAGERTLTLRTARHAEDAVLVAVHDTGPGLGEDFERLVEPFRTSKPGGLGMGLAISRSLVQACGGRLWGEQAAGGGARVCFTLPVAGLSDDLPSGQTPAD